MYVECGRMASLMGFLKPGTWRAFMTFTHDSRCAVQPSTHFILQGVEKQQLLRLSALFNDSYTITKTVPPTAATNGIQTHDPRPGILINRFLHTIFYSLTLMEDWYGVHLG